MYQHVYLAGLQAECLPLGSGYSVTTHMQKRMHQIPVKLPELILPAYHLFKSRTFLSAIWAGVVARVEGGLATSSVTEGRDLLGRGI